MIGKLQRIEATEELIETVAKNEFSAYIRLDWEVQNKYVKKTYRNIAREIIEDFNYAVDTFDKLGVLCTVKEHGSWDVEEYYKE